MAYNNVSTFCILIAFLLLTSFTLTSSARTEPAFNDVTPMETRYKVNTKEKPVAVEESCEGLGEEECLMRRTLAAQIDYIYTQKHNP